MPNTEVKLLSADCSEGFPFVRVGRRHTMTKPSQFRLGFFLILKLHKNDKVILKISFFIVFIHLNCLQYYYHERSSTMDIKNKRKSNYLVPIIIAMLLTFFIGLAKNASAAEDAVINER